MRNLDRYLCVLLVAVAGMHASDLPFAGKWKLNPEKSNFRGMTLAFSELPGGELQATADGESYRFKLDGKEYPGPFGGTVAWKPIDAATWEATGRLNGRVLATDTHRLSGDGKTLTVSSRGTKPNGQPFEDTLVYNRTGGGPGLKGEWKTTKANMNSPNLLEFEPDGSDGMTLRIVDLKAECHARFDGKDYPAVGPTVPPGLTLSLEKSSPGSFRMTEKLNGKEIFQMTFAVSEDGKTLTESAKPASVEETTTVVYDRQ